MDSATKTTTTKTPATKRARKPKDATPFGAALAAVRSVERRLSKINAAHDAAQQAEMTARDERPLVPYPDTLVVHHPSITMVIGAKSVATEAFDTTLWSAKSILEKFKGDEVAAGPMLRALAEHNAAQAALDEESGYADIRAADEKISREWTEAYHAVLDATLALMKVPTRDPGEMAIKKRYAKRWGDADEDMIDFLAAMLQAALDAAAPDNAPPPAPPPLPRATNADPTVSAYLEARRIMGEYAHDLSEHDADDMAPATEMLATSPADLTGVAVRLGRIIGEAWLHRAGDWDCTLCLHKREEVVPPTSQELCAAAEGQNGGSDAPFRALAFLHLGVERLAARSPTLTPDDSTARVLAHQSALVAAKTEYEGLPPSHTMEDEDRVGAKLDAAEIGIRSEPCTSSASAVVKLEAVLEGVTTGAMGDDDATLRQVIDYLRGRVVHPDAELLALGEELERRWMAERLRDQDGVTDAELEAVVEHTGEIAHRIHAITPHTLDGFRVRARAVAWHGHAFDERFSFSVGSEDPSTDTGQAARLVNALIDYPQASPPAEGGATCETLAPIEFEALTSEQAAPPTDENWARYTAEALFALKAAAKILTKSKAELAQFIDGLGETDNREPLVIPMYDMLHHYDEFFEACRTNVRRAAARILVSVSQIVVDEDALAAAQPEDKEPPPGPFDPSAAKARLSAAGVEVWPGVGWKFPHGLSPEGQQAIASLTPEERDAVIDHGAGEAMQDAIRSAREFVEAHPGEGWVLSTDIEETPAVQRASGRAA